jgi:CRP-like cAMP-binding protein
MTQLQKSTAKNLLLRSLGDDVFGLLGQELTYVTLAKGDVLVEPGEAIQNSWFFESGVASVVLTSGQGNDTEVGIIGREGMVDIATPQGVDRSPFRCFIQVPGSAYRLPASTLRSRLDSSPDLRRIMARFVYQFTVQVSGTASANASFTVEQRLARWLLMCHDRLEDDNVELTHEFLALMLNVRRAGVTIALQVLERQGLIEGARGLIVIRDRRGLEAFAGECYGIAEALTLL